jgi:hypothetical protein
MCDSDSDAAVSRQIFRWAEIRQIEWLVDRLACAYTMGLDNPWYSLREGVQENGSQLLILAEDETIFYAH